MVLKLLVKTRTVSRAEDGDLLEHGLVEINWVMQRFANTQFVMQKNTDKELSLITALRYSRRYVTIYGVLALRNLGDVDVGEFWVRQKGVVMTVELHSRLANFVKHIHGGLEYWERIL